MQTPGTYFNAHLHELDERPIALAQIFSDNDDPLATDAVRPLRSSFVFQEGYKLVTHQEEPVLILVAARTKILQIFEELILTVDDAVTPIIDCNYDGIWTHLNHPVSKDRLINIIRDYAEIIINDGELAIDVFDENKETTLGVTLDSHKILSVTSDIDGVSEHIVRRHGITRNQKLKLISSVPHIHRTSIAYMDEYHKFINALKDVDADYNDETPIFKS